MKGALGYALSACSVHPLPLWERVHREARRVRGLSPLVQFCEEVIKDSGPLLKDVVVPITSHCEAFARQIGISVGVGIAAHLRAVLAPHVALQSWTGVHFGLRTMSSATVWCVSQPRHFTSR